MLLVLVMLKILKFNFLWIFYATCLILFSLTIFSNWVLMVCIWFGLFFTFKMTQLESRLLAKEHNLYLNTVLLYPLAETWIKWGMVKHNPYLSNFWLNRLEHFCWSVAIVIIFLPVFTGVYKSLKWWQSLVFVISFICLVGNLNEFFEYFVRMQLNLTKSQQFAFYYWDTIYDMIMNLIGASIGFLILQWNNKLPANNNQ